MILLLLAAIQRLSGDVTGWTGEDRGTETVWRVVDDARALALFWKEHAEGVAPDVDFAKRQVVAIARPFKAGRKLEQSVFEVIEEDPRLLVYIDFYTTNHVAEEERSYVCLSIPRQQKRIEVHVRYYDWGRG